MDQSYQHQVTSVELSDQPSTYLSDNRIEKEMPGLIDNYNGMIDRAIDSLAKTASPSLTRYWEEDLQFWLEKKESLINHVSNK